MAKTKLRLVGLGAVWLTGCAGSPSPTSAPAAVAAQGWTQGPSAAAPATALRSWAAAPGSQASVRLTPGQEPVAVTAAPAQAGIVVGGASVLSAGGASVISAGGASLEAEDAAAGLLDGPEAPPSGLTALAAKAQSLSALAMGPDDPPGLVLHAVEAAPPNFFITDRTPYGVVVTERSAHSVTIAWRTELPTTGRIEYGRAWGFDKQGYTGELRDEVAKTDHKLTLTDLRRWTGYRFRVTAYSALGLAFPEQERNFRTKFWSWR